MEVRNLQSITLNISAADINISIGYSYTVFSVGNAPPIVDFSHWIPKGQYDIYVIGAQVKHYYDGYTR